MGEGKSPLRRAPSHTRLPIVADIGPPVARPVPRTQTPIGMPAPPPAPVLRDRDSSDNVEHVLEIERLERERAELLVELQDAKESEALAKRAAEQLRDPIGSFPPPSMPPPKPKKATIESVPPDTKALEKAIAHSRLGRAATGLGILLALAWNAFNSVRAPAPERVDAVQARVTQNEQERVQKAVEDALERQRTLQALRVFVCWGKQLRGASARQGLDLPSLPPGGVTALRLDQGDPSKPPAFVAAEKCPDLPPLPPEATPGAP